MTVAFWRAAPSFRAKRAAECRRDFVLLAKVRYADLSATVIGRRYIT